MDFYSVDSQGVVYVNQGSGHKIFGPSITLRIEKQVRGKLETTIRRKGYHSGDHRALGMILSKVIEHFHQSMKEGNLVLSVRPEKDGKRGTYVQFYIERTDLRKLDEICKAFPGVKRQFLENELLRRGLNEIMEEIEENENRKSL